MAIIDMTGMTVSGNGSVDGSHPIAHAFDANGATWCAITDSGGNPWVQVDLGQSYICTAFYWQENSTNRPAYENTHLRTSQDGSSWSSVYQITNWSEQPATLPENTAGRYWRVEGTSWSNLWQILGIELDGAPGGGATQVLDVTPDPVWIGGGPCLLTATGTDTEWTAESTVFSADIGEISEQIWRSATEFDLVYTPTESLADITISETQYGLDDTISVVLTPPTEGTNGICQLTPAGATLINDTAALFPSSSLMTEDTVVIPFEYPVSTLTVPQALGEIWTAIFHTGYGLPGGYGPNPYNLLWELINGAEAYVEGQDLNSLAVLTKANTDDLWDKLSFAKTEGSYAVGTLMREIAGFPGGDIQGVLDAIDGLEAGSNQDVLDALAGYFGANPPTIAQLGTMVSDIATIAGYTLGDVLDAIADIPGVDLSGITAKLDAIQPSETYNLSTITTQATGANVAATAAEVALGLLTGDGELSLQTILDAIALLSDKVDALPTSGAPVWPGAANVTLGTPVALSNGLVVTEGMDGVIIAVTTPPTRTGLYQIGDQYYDYGVGRIAFESDGGELEPWQYLGFRAALFTPKSMVRASACHLQVLGGAEGTITPWTVS